MVIAHIRNDRHSSIKMQSPPIADDLAEGQIGFIADDAGAEAFIAIAGRKH